MTNTFNENGWQMGETASGKPLRFHRQLHTSVVRGNRNWLQLRDVTEHVALWFDDQYLGEVEAGFLPRVFELRAVSGGSATDLSKGFAISVEPLHPVRVAMPTVEVFNTGDVRIARYKVLCDEATAERGSLQINVELDAKQTCDATLETSVRLAGEPDIVATHHRGHALAAGRNRLRWTTTIDAPLPWSSRAGANPALYDVTVTALDGAAERVSDIATVTTGFRAVTMAGGSPAIDDVGLPVAFATIGADDDDIEDRLRRLEGRGAFVRFADVMPFDAYGVADQLGIPICQRLPPTINAGRQAIDLLAHHPAIVAWSAPKRRLRAWRPLPDQVQRIVDRGDGTRPLLRE